MAVIFFAKKTSAASDFAGLKRVVAFLVLLNASTHVANSCLQLPDLKRSPLLQYRA